MRNISKLASIVLVTACVFGGSGVCPSESQSQEIEVNDAMIRLIKSVEVPARRSGVIAEFDVREGQVLSLDQYVGKVQDIGFRIDLEKSKLEHQIAQRRSTDDTLVEYAKSTSAVSEAELRRARQANASVDLAISDTEMDRLKLVVDKSLLEIGKATIDLDVAKLTEKLRKVEILDTENELDKHKIKSPIAGSVVRVDKRVGEWVNAGDPLFRIVKMDRLRMEGQIRVDLALGELNKEETYIEVTLPNGKKITKPGKISFVSPEVNPISKKVAIWVEFDNQDLMLRPGLQGTIRIGGGMKPQSDDPALAR